MNTKEKGDKLEDAIEGLENTILKKYVTGERPEILIERNKSFFDSNNVEYKPDIVITLYPNTDYESVIIIECKNWNKEKVKRRHISDFADTINSVNANKGYYVAKHYNEGAENKAKEYKRMELLKADDNVLAIYEDFASLSMKPRILDPSNYQILLIDDDNELKVISSDDLLTTESGQKVNLFENTMKNEPFKEEIVKQCCEWYQKNSTEYGTIDLHYISEFTLNNNKDKKATYFEFENKKYSKFRIRLLGKIHIYKFILESKFDIETKGRYFEYQILDHDGIWKKMVKTDVEALDNKGGKLKRVIEYRFDPPLLM